MCDDAAPLVCSMLTPQAPSGIAVVRLRGQGAVALLGRLLRRPRGQGVPKGARAAYGVIWQADRPLDEVIVVPQSSSRGECLDLCCHGGAAAARSLLELFAAQGVEVRPWTRLMPRLPLDSELLEALLAAEGDTQALLLAHQMSGVLKAAFDSLARLLRTAMRETGVDNCVEPASLRILAQSFAFGRFLREPPLVVITGAPNAGKSTLFNAILGHSRALTSPVPGTTRDPVEARFLLHGLPVRLVDTAGDVEREVDSLVAEGVGLARRLLADADLEIQLLESSAIGRAGSERGNQAARDTGKTFRVYNKVDLFASGSAIEAAPASSGPRRGLLGISALEGAGIPELLGALSRRLRFTDLLVHDGPLAVTPLQVELLERGLAALRQGASPATAEAALARLESYAGSLED